MLWRLVRLDLVNLLRDARLAAGLATFGTIFLLSGVGTWIQVREHARVTAAVAAAERQRWLDQGEKDPHSAAHYSIYAFRPSPPLQAVDPGILPFVGQAVWLEAHLQNDLLFRPQQNATVFDRLGLVDPAGLLTRFGPLAILLLAFAVSARERERGVLAIALGNATSRGIYLTAKLLAVISLALIVLVVPLVLTGALSIATGATVSGQDLLRLIGWTVGAAAFVVVLSLFAVSFCVVAPSGQIACAGLLLAWVGLVLAALPAASAAAEWMRPLPSFQEMKLVLVDEAPAYWTPEAGAEQIAAILRKYGAASERELDSRRINVRGAQLDVAERHAQEVFDREIGGFYDRVAAQDVIYAQLGWLSPAVAFDALSASFAATDFFHHRHFIDAAESYRRALVNRMNADLIPHPAVDGREHTNDASLWSQIPPFAYRLPPPSLALRTMRSPIAALGFWMAAGVALAFLIARRTSA